MKIAFVGKGGSGKSTVSTQFFSYLLEKNKTAVFIDADLNVHAPELLGVELLESFHLAKHKNMLAIRTYLAGSSSKIDSADHFYATTPPSRGVNLFEVSKNNPLIKKYFRPIGSGFVGAVGTYDRESIGISCYHESLSALENLLSFSKPSTGHWTVADMVAGIDAFANSLYMQFDMLVLVVEPTREGVGVYTQYLELAKHAGIANRVKVVANKVDDEDDEAFIRSSIDESHLLGIFEANKQIKKLRQQGEKISLLLDTTVMEKIEDSAVHLYRGPATYLKLLYELHRKFVKQDYIVNAVGDISGQVDEDFRY